MVWRRAVAFLIVAVVATLWWPAVGHAEGPPRVYAGVYLHDVSSFDQKDGVFDVDAEVWAKWRGEFDPGQLQIANASRVEVQDLGQQEDGEWNGARWRVRGTLRGEFPVQDFPFDEQTIAVVLELPAEAGELVPDLAASGMATRFSITDWLYEPRFHLSQRVERYPSDLGSLAGEGAAALVQGLGFEVKLKRPIRPVVIKLFLPLAIVAIIVLASLFVHPTSIETRVTMGVTGLVACIAFQFSLSDVLPDVAYLTLADSLFILVYVLSMLCVGASVLAAGLTRYGRLKVAVWSDRICRPAFFFGALIAVWIALPEATSVVVDEVDPVPEMAREASERQELRIGTNLTVRRAANPVFYAASWPLVYEEPHGGERWPVFVERAPGVDNAAVRFLAGGELEVEWRLREGIRWSDGEPVTVEDLTLPLEASPDPAIREVFESDDRTVVLVWEERVARALEAPSVWPAHVLREVYEEEGYDGALEARREGNPPTLGPYRIVSFDEDHLRAEANPYFIGPAPNIRTVEVRRYADREALKEAFLEGEVDITLPNGVTGEHLEEVEARRPGTANRRASAIMALLQPDLSHPLLGDREIRRSILMAIDRGRLAEEVYGEPEWVAHLPAPGEPPAGTRRYDYDPEGAREILEARGAVGETLRLVVPGTAIAEVVDGIAGDLREVGWEVEIEEVSTSVPLFRTGDHGGLLLHVARGGREGSVRRWWNLQTVEGRYDPTARHDAYTDEVAQMVERETRSLFVERREQLRDAIFVAFSENLPLMPLLFADERVLADPALAGWEVGPEVPFGRGMEGWRFVEGEAHEGIPDF